MRNRLHAVALKLTVSVWLMTSSLLIVPAVGDCMVTAAGLAWVEGAPATSVKLNSPIAMCTDDVGGMYVADYNFHRVFYVSKDGGFFTFAGDGRDGNYGEGIPATSAVLGDITGLAFDKNKSGLFIADSTNDLVKFVDAAGIITKAIGGGGLTPDPGYYILATDAALDRPTGLAADGRGGLYMTERGGGRVNYVLLSNMSVIVVAGSISGSPYGTNGVSAVQVQLQYPYGVSPDSNGGFLFTELNGHRVRRVDSSGKIQTVAGNGDNGFRGDQIPATATSLNGPFGIVGLANGTFCFTDQSNSRVRCVNEAGILSTIAGDGGLGYTGDGIAATLARLNYPTGLSLDAAGTGMYVADSSNSRVRHVIPTTGIITTVVGGAATEGNGDGGLATLTTLDVPMDVVGDGAGGFYVSEYHACNVRHISATGVISTLMGLGHSGQAEEWQLANTQPLWFPWGLAVDTDGSVLVPDATNRVFAVSASDGMVHAAAGATDLFGYNFDGDGLLANDTRVRLSFPGNMAVDKVKGGFYIVDQSNSRIRHVLRNGTIVTAAGNGESDVALEGVPAHESPLLSPVGVEIDGAGGFYLLEQSTARILHVLSNGNITILVDQSPTGFSNPSAIRSDGVGNLFLADTGHHTIHRVYMNGTSVSIAGMKDFSGFRGDGGPATAANLRDPVNAGPDGSGGFYIADKGNNRVRRVVKECDVNVTSLVCAAGTHTAECTLRGSGFYPPLYLVLSGIQCTDIVTVSSGVVTAVCILPAAEMLEIEVRSQFGRSTFYLPSAKPPVLGLPSVAYALHWGGTLRINSTSPGLADVTSVSFVAPYGNDPTMQLPCFDVAASSGLTGGSLFVCTLSLAWETGMYTPLQLRLAFSNGAVTLVPLNQTNITIIRPAIATVSGVDMLSTSGGDTLIASLPLPMISNAAVTLLAPSLASRCGGMSSRLRGWMGLTPCLSCVWINASSLSCVTPAGNAVVTRWTVEICGLFNITSDGSAPGALVQAAAVTSSEYRSYNPTLQFDSVATTSAQPVSRFLGRATLLIPLSGDDTSVSALISLTTSVYVDRVQCSGMQTFINGSKTALVCMDWPVQTDAALPASSFGATSVAVEVTMRGTRVMLPQLLRLVYLPSITSVTPAALSPGGTITLVGYWLNAGGTPVVLLGASLPCLNVSQVTSTSLVCLLPSLIPPTTPGYPSFRVTVITTTGASLEPVVVTVPVAASIQITSVPAMAFFPSDSSHLSPLQPALAVTVMGDDGRSIAGCTCTLTVPSGPAVLVSTYASDASLLSTGVPADAFGSIRFPFFGINIAYGTDNYVPLRLACQRPSGNAPASIAFNASVMQLHMSVCTSVPSTAASRQPLDAFSVAIGLATETTNTLCSGGASTSLVLPAIACAVSQRGTNDTAYIRAASAEFSMQGAQATSQGRLATFSSLMLTAVPGVTFPLQLTCNVGGLNLPPLLPFDITMQHCPSGAQASGAFCVQCASDEFSVGAGDGLAPVLSTCQRCPTAGASCANGLVSVLPDYFRAPSQRDQPLGPASLLYACTTAGACLVNASTLVYSCASGYTGPLCGICDAQAEYARLGAVCDHCWAPASSQLLLAVLILAITGLLVRVAMRTTAGPKTDASIALKITLSYLQAVGSLRSFTAGGTAAYHSVMGWSDTVSASPFGFGALQCLWRPDFLTSYVATILLPVAASLAVILIFTLLTTLRHCRPAGRGKFEFDRWACSTAIRGWLQQRRHVATLLFTLFVSYMAIISTSLKALDCISPPIDGVTYLRVDLREVCNQGPHAIATVLAYLMLVLVGAGFPLGLAYLLLSATPKLLADQQFQSAFGFLYGGYRTSIAELAAGGAAGGGVKDVDIIPSSLKGRRGYCKRPTITHYMWWESVSLLRKAGIVLLAVLVQNPYIQSNCAALWLAFFLALQIQTRPYASTRFNVLETVSLSASMSTAIISSMLLQYNVDDPSMASQEPAAMTSEQWGITITMILINLGALTILGGTWLTLQAAQSAKAAPVVVVRKLSSRFLDRSPSSSNVLPSKESASFANPMAEKSSGGMGNTAVSPSPSPQQSSSSGSTKSSVLSSKASPSRTRMSSADLDGVAAQMTNPLANRRDGPAWSTDVQAFQPTATRASFVR